MQVLLTKGIDDELVNQFVELAEDPPLHMVLIWFCSFLNYLIEKRTRSYANARRNDRFINQSVFNILQRSSYFRRKTHLYYWSL